MDEGHGRAYIALALLYLLGMGMVLLVVWDAW